MDCAWQQERKVAPFKAPMPIIDTCLRATLKHQEELRSPGMPE